MGKKIFISYKYDDRLVKPLPGEFFTKGRSYVDKIQTLITKEDHINLGEKDGEDLSDFKDETIASKLRDKIFQSSITIVLITKGMKDTKPEDEQWIPWEVSYSLKETTREDRTSKTNAILAVVVPDENGSYEYFLTHRNCCDNGCTFFSTGTLFKILAKNMFNQKNKKQISPQCPKSNSIYSGYPSYIHSVKWEDFYSLENFNKQIDICLNINKNINDYDIVKEV